MLSRDDRIAAGREQADAVPVDAHAELAAPEGRPDPVAVLAAQDVTRLQKLVPVRHGRMRVSAFTFFRGGAAVMAADLSRTATTGLRVQLCGDAHLSNFGLFKGPDRRLVFDLNDFDETAPGPFEWDLKRLAASVTIAGRNNGLSDKKIASATRASVRGYRQVLARTTELSPLEVHYYRMEIESLQAGADKKDRRRSEKAVVKASRKNSLRALDKLTEEVSGQPRIVDDPPVVVRLDEQFEADDWGRLVEFFDQYRATLAPHRAAMLERYRFVDMAHKVVGVGSVGTRCLIVLLQCDRGTPLFMQFKEATHSVLEPYVGTSQFDQAGERVVRGQRLMQSAGDILLGWSRYENERGTSTDFYFRQLWDGKGSAEVDEMGPKRLKNYATHCGAALALAHARTGDAVMISSYLGDDKTADHVFTEFAGRYADLNERDHRVHEKAIESGRLAATDGV
ncbi:MAG: DUF2252 domain-containing protein [Actinomycetia bacterium]|nr:DUF2252 domain-containing protein [Actinomycetes bacterium]